MHSSQLHARPGLLYPYSFGGWKPEARHPEGREEISYRQFSLWLFCRPSSSSWYLWAELSRQFCTEFKLHVLIDTNFPLPTFMFIFLNSFCLAMLRGRAASMVPRCNFLMTSTDIFLARKFVRVFSQKDPPPGDRESLSRISQLHAPSRYKYLPTVSCAFVVSSLWKKQSKPCSLTGKRT